MDDSPTIWVDILVSLPLVLHANYLDMSSFNSENTQIMVALEVRTIIKFENGGTNLARYKSHTAALRRQKIDLRQTEISGLDSFLRSSLR
ncbi:hypothetical protein LXL04_036500 [Taraxacum kok-saghyz]